MITARELYEWLDLFAPFSLAEDWDNAGLQVGRWEQRSETVLLALDATVPAIEEAKRLGAKILLTHHPVIFDPLRSIDGNGIPARLIRAGVTVISAHTNLDVADGGVNDVLARLLGLQNLRGFDPEHAKGGMTLGRIGELERELTPEQLADHVKAALGCAAVSLTSGKSPVRSVAVSGGHCSTAPVKAVEYGAQAFISGEISHDAMLEAAQLGLTLIDAGHYPTENPAVSYLRDKLAASGLAAEFRTFEPGAPYVVR